MKAFGIATTALVLFAGCALVAGSLDPSLSCNGKCGSEATEDSSYCYCKSIE